MDEEIGGSNTFEFDHGALVPSRLLDEAGAAGAATKPLVELDAELAGPYGPASLVLLATRRYGWQRTIARGRDAEIQHSAHHRVETSGE